ncbi:unnamed protein product [Callosobruchus maculatus]|uniref:Uncharacterized protein n=1 Tax=Callosobruchus maculatus TaxID=64391 RepID=A0A653CHU1_CALMS|nr:unnamed protein product [Callosobruchus maculatus]
MSIRERLKVAYENAAFGADKTWSSGFHSLEKPHMDLLLRESQIQDTLDGVPTPRTVNEAIPHSKLAMYFDYPYNNSRELSYAADFRQPDCVPMCFKHDVFKEPWMCDAVEYHCRYYMECFNRGDVAKKSFAAKPPLESPFLKVGHFPEYFIKIGLNSKAVRRLWDTKNPDTRSFMYRTPSPCPDRSLILYKPPMGEVVCREHDNENLTFLDTTKAYEKDETHLRLVEASLKQHQDQQKVNCTETQAIACTSDSSQSKRLYSAVLQGYSTNKNAAPPAEGQMTILKRTVPKNDRTVQVDSTGSSTELDKKKEQEQIPVWRQNRQATNTLVRSLPISVSSEVVPTANHLIPQLNAARLLANALVHPPLAPQNLLHLCHPVLIRRPIHNAVASRPPLLAQNHFQASTSHHMFKPKAKTKPQTGSLKRTNPSGATSSGTVRKNMKVETPSNNNQASSRNEGSFVDIDQELDELVLRVVDVVLREPDPEPEPENVFPVTGSLSDELERQALEQYTGSNDNVFQELERQAVEEYDCCSENCKSPPNCKALFGGFFNFNFFIL